MWSLKYFYNNFVKYWRIEISKKTGTKYVSKMVEASVFIFPFVPRSSSKVSSQKKSWDPPLSMLLYVMIPSIHKTVKHILKYFSWHCKVVWENVSCIRQKRHRHRFIPLSLVQFFRQALEHLCQRLLLQY